MRLIVLLKDCDHHHIIGRMPRFSFSLDQGGNGAEFTNSTVHDDVCTQYNTVLPVDVTIFLLLRLKSKVSLDCGVL